MLNRGRELNTISLTRESSSPAETEACGRDLAESLTAGDVVLLYGDLGAGKSVFARGIIQALPGGKNRVVRSPTYVYIQHHPTVPPVNHADLYRLPMNAAPEDIGLDEWSDSKGLLIIEWAQRLSSRELFPRTEVFIEIVDENRRKIQIRKREGINQTAPR